MDIIVKIKKASGLDDFQIWLMSALDRAEDQYYEALEMGADINTINELLIKRNTLIKVRDTYCKLKNSKGEIA